MMQISVRLTEVTQAHLDRLIATKALEGPHLEFKGQLPQKWDGETKHEFVADTSAFANAGGGDLIFGLVEDADGQASALAPIPGTGIDDEVQRLQNFLRDLVEPRMQGADVRAVPVATAGANGFAIVVRIPASWNGPHRVKTNKGFYVREGGRRREIDVPEIRALFFRSESQAQRIRDFRSERIGKLISGEMPHPLVRGAYMMVHVVPTQSILGLLDVDVAQYLHPGPSRLPVLGGTTAYSVRLNFDGALQIRNPDAQGHTHGYTQLFRSGVFEGVMALSNRAERKVLSIPSLTTESSLIRFLGDSQKELNCLGVSTECAFLLTLVHVKGAELGFNVHRYSLSGFEGKFDRDLLVFPDVLVEDGASPQTGLRPVLDMLWQSVGLAGSENYDPTTGEWRPVDQVRR